jgi:subtilisin family serine protease
MSLPRRARLNLEILEARDLPSALPPVIAEAGSYASDHILVRWLDGNPQSSNLTAGAESLGNNTWSLKLQQGVSVADAVTYYSHLPGVDFAQPDYEISLAGTPNDPGFSQQWSLKNTGQYGGTPGDDIGATTAWNAEAGASTIIVAVIDSGIDYNHPDLAANMWHNPSVSSVGDVYGASYVTGTETGNPYDDNGHGTVVAGIIGAVANNGIGISGVAPNVKIMDLKFLDGSGNGNTANAIQAVYYAVNHGAKIINASWGGSGSSSALQSAIDYARAHGVIFVAAAGNNSANNDTSAQYPADYPEDNVVSVAATDWNDKLASYSNYGPTTVDLAAPGSYIYSTYPTNLDGSNPYRWYSGSSMAAPEVAGALALVWGLHPSWSYSQVINDVLGSVDKLSGLSGKVATGGRLDLAKAVAAAATPTPSPTPTPPSTPTTTSSTGNFGSGNVNVPIRDLQSATASLVIPIHGTIADLNVKVNISDINDANLVVKLVSPTGREVILANQRGPGGRNFSFTVFDDEAATPIANGKAPFTGSFRPESPLSAFDGSDIYGTWKLVVTDMVKGNAGTIQNFTITSVAKASSTTSAATKSQGMEENGPLPTPASSAVVGSDVPEQVALITWSGYQPASAVEPVLPQSNAKTPTATRNESPPLPRVAPVPSVTASVFVPSAEDSDGIGEAPDSAEVDALLAALFIQV